MKGMGENMGKTPSTAMTYEKTGHKQAMVKLSKANQSINNMGTGQIFVYLYRRHMTGINCLIVGLFVGFLFGVFK